MSIRRVLVSAPQIDFGPMRRELELPESFPAAALAAAERIAAGPQPLPAVDRTGVELVTIDPPTSMDLDQAVRLERRVGGGYRVWYAISDVASYLLSGATRQDTDVAELVTETWRRGETIYLPDGKVPLHPPVLSEGAASLLPDQVRAAVLWTIDLDSDGATVAVRVERAAVRSRAKLDYAGVQAAVDAGRAPEPVALLPEIGKLLLARGLARGAVNLPIPEQEVVPDGEHGSGDHGSGDHATGGHGSGDGRGWRLVLREVVPVEEYNAQISLLTGMSAAQIMLDGRVGLLRTMPEPRPESVAMLRAAAASLGIPWPEGASVGAVVASVRPDDPRGAAFVDQATELNRGAGYTAFDGNLPEQRTHGGVAAPYAHVTAPLRRLADRYATEVCLALAAGQEVPEWARAALPELPAVMAASARRASAADRGAVDLAEAVLLSGRVGEWFDAAVLDIRESRPSRNDNNGRREHGQEHGQRPSGGAGGTPEVVTDSDRRQFLSSDGNRSGKGGTVAVDDPPVRARCDGEGLPLGRRVRVRLVSADPVRREVRFAYERPGVSAPDQDRDVRQ